MENISNTDYGGYRENVRKQKHTGGILSAAFKFPRDRGRNLQEENQMAECSVWINRVAAKRPHHRCVYSLFSVYRNRYKERFVYII